MEKKENINPADKNAIKREKESFPGYPAYPESQDVYTRFKEEEDIDPENVSKKKAKNYPDEKLNEKDFKQDKSGDDLDIPGVESLNRQGSLANEDEENDYFSLGGDNHNDLEEDKN